MQSSPTLPSLFPAAADPGGREPRSSQPVEHGWAWDVRQSLASQLQETGRPDPQHLDALVAELIAVFAKVLQRSSRSAWLHLLDVLQLLSPFREQLRCREELLPYMENLCYQYYHSQALVSDLDVLGAMGQAFPRDNSELCAHPLAARYRDPVPLANLLPVGSEPAFAGQPCPFVLDQEVEEPAALCQPGPVSLQELQRSVGLVGMEVAQKETQWKSNLGLMSLALGTEVPVKYCCAEPRLLPDPGREAAMPTQQVVEGELGFSWQSLTGLRAAEIFVRNRHLGKINFVYLNIAPDRHFRPYDLVVVPKRQANPQHYVFSPFGVLHVHPEEGAEALTLGEWHREAMLWQLLQCIPFFRHYVVRKAFARWWQNVKHLQLLTRQEALGSYLLLAVPHFGAALLHISRLLQELRSVHWLPQDDSKCYTFPELQQALAQENGRARGLLKRFLTLCSAILELVRDDTYKMVHGLQIQAQSYKLYITKESLYLQRVHYRDLERRLKEAEFWMQRLGSLAQLVNLLTCQNLVSIVQEKVTAFVSNVMKANGTTRKAVLRVHLVFDADSQLVPFPSSQVLETSLLGALEAVVESVLQVTRTRKEKPVTQPEQSPGETESLRSQDLAMVLCKPQPSAFLETDKGGPGAPEPQSLDELLQSLPAEELCGQEPQLVHHLDLKVIGGLEVSGHRLRSQYPVPSREQLEQDLHSDSSIQGALASQRALLAEALSETQEICKQHTWVAEIHSFAHSWSPKQLELMKGWPAGKYVQRVVQLRAWTERVREVPSMIITCNRLLMVDCSTMQQETVSLLDSIIKEILSLLLSETSQRSEILISELGGVLQLYQSVSTDIIIIAKCSQKLEQYEGQMTELQERVEYVRALNEVIRQHFRPFSLDEENLENLLLDTWEAFKYQQQEASDFIVSRRLSIVAELVDSLQRGRQELQELLTMATTGQFLDPSQSPCAMEQELQELHCRFQAMATRVAELCRSQRILTGEGTDVSFVARSRGLIEAHKHVWKLFRTISEQITEWRCLAFSKFNAPLATEKMAEWQREVSHMEESLPADHPILQACVHMITSFQQFLPLLQKLASSLMKNSCWREFFMAMGVKCPGNLQFTLGQLLSYPLLEHSDTILKIWSSERGCCQSLDNLRRLQKAWAERQFRLVNFILSVPYQAPLPDRACRPPNRRYRPPKQEYISKDSGTFVLADTAELKALTEKSLLTLKNIILSPHAMELREEAESWTSTLRGFGALLDVWVSFQQKWIFLNIVLYEMDISLPSGELDCLFQKLDSRFRELMQVTSKHPLVLSSVMPMATSNRESRFMGVPLQTMLSEGVEDLQLLIHALEYVLEATRMGFPRLFFLSNTEVVAMVASPAEPMEVTIWARRCFPTVHQLAFRQPSTTRDPVTYAALLPVSEATGLVGACGETVPLCSPLPLNQKVTKWLCALEQRMKESLFHLLQACMAQRLALRPQLDVAFEQRPAPSELPRHLLVEHWGQLATDFPAQCVLLAEEALWFADVQERLFGTVRRPGLKLKHRLKLEALAHYVRNYRSSHAGQPGSAQLSTLLGALLTVTVHQRDVLTCLLERKVDSPTAFAWAQLLKYRLVLHPESARAVGAPIESWAASPPRCWAEILDIRLHYDYEYVGNCPHLVGSPQLDRSFLGFLLALEEFRCGAALGYHGVGKTATMQHLARALGRQLVTLHCSQQMGLGCLHQHLSGAVQAGAWLLLEAVDQLGPSILSGFSQLLSDLQMLCMGLQPEKGQVTPNHRSKNKDREGQEQPARALPELVLDEAEPYQSRVLGNILFGERLLQVRETYGCLATLQRLPELLRLALRPVALLPPDLHKVAEVTLLAAGFREAAHLAKKLSYFFWLEGELGPGPAPIRLALFKGVIEAAIGIVYPPMVRPQPEPRQQLTAQQSSFEGLAEEPALIQALCLSPFLSALEDPRLSRVWELLRGVFPASCSLFPEAHAPPRLLSAVTAQLHEDKLHADPELTSTIVQLSQALLGSPGVLLVGPAGSGKTTAWKTLAKVLSRLAVSKSLELAPGVGSPGTQKDMAYLPISTVCLCPNSLSTSEFLGRLEGGIWREGVFSRLLQRMASSAPATGLSGLGTQQWMVLDGSASSEWLDPISSLFSAEPALSLPTGQCLHSPEGVKFLFELPDVSSISPSISTRCALLHCGGSCVWRALLASSLATIYHRYSVSQESVVMLRRLAEDVFPPTLTFLQQHCSSLLQPHADLRSPMAWGVPETTAFTRLLKALLDRHLSHDKAKAQPLRREEQAVAENSCAGVSAVPSPWGLDEAVPSHHHLLVRSIFVFAYIWGFSGHLHPRHWAFFDSFARRVLYSSCYTIELPSTDSVFDLYPQPEDGKLEVFDGKYLSGRVKAVPVSFTILPQYERLLYVLDLLLGSRQPVLLAGEPGCGKSSFAELLIQPNHSYHRVAISPALGAGHVRHLLESHILGSTRDKALFTSLPGSRSPAARGRRSCYLLLLDDLHAAELDARQGSHPVVETLRQALSHQEVYGAESLELRQVPSAEFNCFGLVAAPAIGVHPLSPRFTRLCSILSLPSVSRESLISIHRPLVLAWLEKFPLMARHSELATALVGATVDVYEAMTARFRSSPACYHFSYHHIEKVLRGLFLLRPCPGIHLTSPLEDTSTLRAGKRAQPGTSLSLTLSTRVIVRLWLHESLRIFCDPLLSERERQESGQLLLDVAARTFCTKRSVLRVVSTRDKELLQHERARSVIEPAGQDAAMELGAEQGVLADSHEEPSSQSSSDEDWPNAFDPIDQAPALALDQPDTVPFRDSALGALESDGAEATEMKRMVSIQPFPALRPHFQEQHSAMGRRTSTRRTTPLKSKHRPSIKKESTKPLLPSHLLLLPGEDVHNILFSRELAPASSSQESLYHERCWDAIQRQLSTFLPRGFVLCREVTQHLVRLLRVLCCPQGHGALLSLHLSTGRRSLVALAANATCSQLFELTGQAGEWEVRELIRKASWQAGILDTRAVVLVHQGVAPGTMQKLVDLMREGTYPGLYTAGDTAHIVKELLQENQNIKRTMRPNMVLQRFYQFVRNNLHMLLLLDGRKGWAKGRGPWGYPTAMATAMLTLTCSTDVYQPWSQESLVQVATQRLEDVLSQQPLQSPVPASLQALENSLASIASAMALIHRSASCYATHLAPTMPLVTPKTFLDFLDIFLMFSAQLQRQSQTQADRMKLALTKMWAVSEKQREHNRDIKYLQEKLRMAKEQVARCRRWAEHEEVVQKQQEQDCQHREARIEILTQEQQLLEQSKESATRKMNTEYKAALAGLQVQDIEELRSYRLPPASILRVTDTLCMMFNKEPGWESAKQLLGQEDFYQELLFYPKDELPSDLFQALGQVVSDASFCAASLQSISKSAAALCQWICAIYWYHQALRIWEPTLMQLQQCKLQIRAEKGRLGDRHLQAEKLKELSSGWGVELLKAIEHQEAVDRELRHILQEKEKAGTVESSMAMHVANWTAAVKLLEQNCSTAQGDALLCAAAVSYLGAFPPPRRQELLEKWQDICARRQSSLGPDDVRRVLEKELPCPGPAPHGPALLPVRQDFCLLTMLSSEREQRAWVRARKPQDLAGRQAALLLCTDAHACSRSWPLLLDPDQQALTWLLVAQKVDEDESLLFAGSDTLSSAKEPGSNKELPEKNLQVLSATDPRLEQNLLAAASTGLPVLLLDFEKSPGCPILLQLLQKETLLGAGGCTLCSESLGAVEVLPSFRLYLSTTLPLRDLGEEMDHAFLKGLTVIDLSLSQSALEDLLLEEVLNAEKREAQTHWRTLQLSILQLEDKLEDTEEELLELISQPSGPLLEEEEFLPLVRLLQIQLETLHASHQHLLSLRQHHLAMQAKYRQVARLGAALHQALQQVCRLHPLYHCSPASCLAIAHRALLATKRAVASKQEALEVRLVELSKCLSRQLLANAQPHLQESHNLLLSFLGALAPLRLAGQLSPLDWLVFCQGLQAPAVEQLLQPARAARPGWVRAAAWHECGLLEGLPGFQGLRASLAEQAAQWQEYFRLPATVVGPALCPSHAHLSLFQRAMLWRIFCPEKLSSMLHDLVICLLGRPIAEDASYSAATIYTCSQTDLPLLFLTSPWGLPGAATHPLHWIQQMAKQRHCLDIVVISLGTPGCMHHVAEALGTCPKLGHWLVLNNCHRQERWPPAVLAQLSKLQRTPEGGAKAPDLPLADMKGDEIHPKFRLWLIAAADATGAVPALPTQHMVPLPHRVQCAIWGESKPKPPMGRALWALGGGAVHRSAVTLFCETPQELKSSLQRSYSQLLGQPAWHAAQEQGLALLVLHTVLLHRQHYGSLAQARLYPCCPRSHHLLCSPRSEAELFTGLRLQERLAKVVSNPEVAMQELAGSILYGGYILDAGDAEAVQSLSQQCLGSASRLLPPQGVQTLLTTLIRGSNLGKEVPLLPSLLPQGCREPLRKLHAPEGREWGWSWRSRDTGRKGAATDCSFLPPALPEEDVIADTRARIQQLPGLADPASCGLHQGLQQQLLESQSPSLLADLLRSQDLWQPAPALSTQQEALGQLVQQGLELVQELQDTLQQRGWEVGAKGRLPSGRTRPKPRPLLRFLLEECGSFLALLQQVERDLHCAREQLKGRPCQSPRCSTILRALEQGRLPRPWLPYAPTGPQDTSRWLQTLKCRCQLLCGYLGLAAGQPVVLYHLSAFQYPRRLLLALLQEAARVKEEDLDHYHLDQQVLPCLLPPSSPPESGLYLTGLELHHALWDTQSALLKETLLAQPCLLPPIWVQAVGEAWRAPRPTASLLQYSCPLYLGLPQQPVCLSSQRAVMHLALPCTMPPALCAQRRVHIVSTLPCLE
ncbi:LOW QUALITY PROTEIN: dynein heavy chain domain-containing protein 1 [Dermochelys coriacea]|uniref:LOW QUALITY PROTEIN: dynein heavy chain domain-containing protein 1 n=1 Tax=Dermochelys coriacea TaxID=27794 RepID=UPI001CA7C3B2|nr:LOW QUALITY PROTEIN: dynein heavy chain domain-containing protein 1 [Dermochelys coriacea]